MADPSMPSPEPVVVKPVMESPVMSGFNNFTQSFASKTLVLQWLAYVLVVVRSGCYLASGLGSERANCRW